MPKEPHYILLLIGITKDKNLAFFLNKLKIHEKRGLVSETLTQRTILTLIERMLLAAI